MNSRSGGNSGRLSITGPPDEVASCRGALERPASGRSDLASGTYRLEHASDRRLEYRLSGPSTSPYFALARLSARYAQLRFTCRFQDAGGISGVVVLRYKAGEVIDAAGRVMRRNICRVAV